MASDWRNIENEKEKYQRYLASREWGVLKEAVRERARGKCERCKVLPIDATHHLTYARKYCEQLEDLQGICQWCHDFTHGKSDLDPVIYERFIRYVSSVAEAGGLFAVGWHYMFRWHEEIHSDVPASAIMLLHTQSLMAGACTYYHAVQGELTDGWEVESSIAKNWMLCATILQKQMLGYDLIGWLQHDRPICDNPEHYDRILEKFGLLRTDPDAKQDGAYEAKDF